MASRNHPSWFDPAMPRSENSVLPASLIAAAAAHPDKEFISFHTGARWTYGDTLDLVRKWADGLRELGVRRGDRVALWMGDGPENVLAWFATTYLGAVIVPMNTAVRGGVLAHVIENSGARVMLTEPRLSALLSEEDRGRLDVVATIGDASDGDVSLETLVAGQSGSAEAADLKPWDLHAIMYTSGTTGPSKGVLCSYLHTYTISIVAYGYMEAADRILVNMPLFHVTGFTSVYAALLRRASIFMTPGFSASRFWSEVRANECTTTAGMVGSLTAFLAKNTPRDDDRDQPLRMAIAYPIDDSLRTIGSRHNFSFFTGFGMTEVPMPIVSDVNGGGNGESGRPRSGVQCKVVDEYDIEVLPGTVGELVVRSDLPWVVTPGYNRDHEATAKAWRNGWFHTGDAFRMDTEGRYYFIDRMKDSIRRRGENISSHEVERELIAHPLIRDAAVVPITTDVGDDEVMAVLELATDETPAFTDLVEFLRPRMAYFMVPRYIRIVPSLPRTETNKVKKQELRTEGVTVETWDREAAGIILNRANA